MVAGGACIGCTMPGFPDKFSPFYKAPPGSLMSGGATRVYGAGIRRLRRVTMRNRNREPIWDRANAVPSAYSRRSAKPSLTSKLEGFFYNKLQYSGTVDQAKRNREQPQPKSMNILERDAEAQALERYEPGEPLDPAQPVESPKPLDTEEGADVSKKKNQED